MELNPRVSVICCTLDRADALAKLLVALRQLTYPSFEVVVVAGPCSDHTMDVLAPYTDEIKVLRCPEKNLSMSRNIGICAAAGEIVAFIDDDGVPEPTWLDELVAGYADDEVAGVGGVVRDHTGFTFQCRYNRVDRSGNADFESEMPLDDLCFPGSQSVPYLIGTNSSFRRDRLVEVGGFDEEFNFYLDESDVCVRLVDAGWVLRQLAGAEVHHKFLPSGVRNVERVTVDLTAPVKNRIYFSLLHARPDTPTTEIMSSHADWVRHVMEGLEAHHGAGRVTDEELVVGRNSVETGWEAGLLAGYRGRRVMIDPVAAAEPPPFKAYATVPPPERRLRLCFVTQTYPPLEVTGNGRHMAEMARSLVRRGHEVHVITTSNVHNTVDLEDGVWVHRIGKSAEGDRPTCLPSVPPRIWSNALAVAQEVERIDSRHPVDAVYGVMWDVETIAILSMSDVPVVTSLVTTLGLALESREDWRDDAEFMETFGRPMLDLERWLIEESDVIHAISDTIKVEVERSAGVEIASDRVVVAPLGMDDRVVETRGSRSPEGRRRVLFVGRFEPRKGIDLLLDAIPLVMRSDVGHDVEFELIGNDSLPWHGSNPIREQFESRHGAAPWAERVTFRGVVDDEEMWRAYEHADLFVAPSRFESFGLVYVEAMMWGLPVVALDAGAAPEVVGEAGVLVREPTAAALAQAIERLLGDPDDVARLGLVARRRYEERYAPDVMAARMEAMFSTVVGRRRPLSVTGLAG